MRQRNRLRHLAAGPSGAVGQRLRRLAEWAVASTFTASMGCSSQLGVNTQLLTLTDSPSDASGAWTPVVCGDLLLIASPITPALPFDYLAIFLSAYPGSGYVDMLSDYGNPCQGAQDRTACLTALAQSVSTPLPCGMDAPFCTPSLVTTTGDTLQRYDYGANLAPLLGEIDTPLEAVLAAQMQGLKLACPADSFVGLDPATMGTFVQRTASGYRVKSTWEECGSSDGSQLLEVHSDGSVGQFERNEAVKSSCIVGRRPAGLELSGRVVSRQQLGAFLAECARLEAASVPAFARLARELRQLGAATLAGLARRSARDEVRHTGHMTRLAARYGGAVEAPRISAPARTRSGFEVACENAIEGCVRESFGAVVAWQQAAHARDPVVARVMREIAEDETRHADLAWRVAEWLEPQLPERERAAVSGARAQALRQLDAEIAEDPLPSDVRAVIGWPSAASQHTLLNRMAGELGMS